MAEEDVDLPPVEKPINRSARKHKERLEGEAPRKVLIDPEGAHKKFMAVMIGLFLLALLLMFLFNQHMDFAVDGGI
jgi:hypothetical protein